MPFDPRHLRLLRHAVYLVRRKVFRRGPPSFCSRSDDGGFFRPSISATNPPSTYVAGFACSRAKYRPMDRKLYVRSTNVTRRTCGRLPRQRIPDVRHVQTECLRRSPQRGFQDPAVAHRRKRSRRFCNCHNDNQSAISYFGRSRRNVATSWKRLDFMAFIMLDTAAIAGNVGRARGRLLTEQPPGRLHCKGLLGVWHLYCRTTFDGGLPGPPPDATPKAPCTAVGFGPKVVQYLPQSRLDFFDMTVEHDDAFLVVYVMDVKVVLRCVSAATYGIR